MAYLKIRSSTSKIEVRKSECRRRWLSLLLKIIQKATKFWQASLSKALLNLKTYTDLIEVAGKVKPFSSALTKNKKKPKSCRRPKGCTKINCQILK